MENQPPIRPWSRLASIAQRDAAPGAPAPPRPPIQAPVPRIPLARAPTMSTQAPPTLQQETLPPPPQQQPSQNQQSSRLQASPPQPSQNQQSSRLQASPPPPSPRIRIPSRDPTPPESPRVIRSSSSTPAESPRTRTFRPFPAQPPTPNPEPERKPSPNPEPEPKSVMESIPIRQERSTSSVKAAAGINKESGDDGGATPVFPRNKQDANKTSATSRKKDDGGTWKAITIAGENMGSYMELGSSQHHHQKHQKEKHQNGHQQYQGLEIESGGEVGTTAGKKGEKNERKPIAAVVNSNVQSINNSLLFSSKCRQKSPGVHLAFASHRQPKPSRGSSDTDPSFANRN